MIDPVAPTIDRLRELVDQSGLTRTEIASRASMTPGMLTRLLSGRRNPSIDSVRRILFAIGCEWGELDPIR
jgi:transcriptional regulator with XRE-family HTH domain